MNFLSMEYFQVIVEEGGFSRASGKLFVSQQSLSEHIKKLEDELGVPLFVRGRPLKLTVAGEAFLKGSKKILDTRTRMLQELALVTQKRRSKITIASATFDIPPFLPRLLTRFAEEYPQYEAVVVKRLAADISHNMSGVDLYFSWLPLDQNLEHTLLIEDDYYVVVINKLLLATTFGARWRTLERELAETGNLALINELPFTLLYDRNGFLSRDLECIFSEYNLNPIVGFQSENGELNAEMCTYGSGAFLAPHDFCLRKFHGYTGSDDSPLSMYRINVRSIQCCLALSYEKGKRLNPAEKDFIELTRAVLNEKLV